MEEDKMGSFEGRLFASEQSISRLHEDFGTLREDFGALSRKVDHGFAQIGQQIQESFTNNLRS